MRGKKYRQEIRCYHLPITRHISSAVITTMMVISGNALTCDDNLDREAFPPPLRTRRLFDHVLFHHLCTHTPRRCLSYSYRRMTATAFRPNTRNTSHNIQMMESIASPVERPDFIRSYTPIYNNISALYISKIVTYC
jgi:hypothetical protein